MLIKLYWTLGRGKEKQFSGFFSAFWCTNIFCCTFIDSPFLSSRLLWSYGSGASRRFAYGHVNGDPVADDKPFYSYNVGDFTTWCYDPIRRVIYFYAVSAFTYNP